MSRCFPYPPPGYTLSRASKESLIESIELQKAKDITKEQRKEKRKEKKEKRKEKKEKSKDRKDRKKEKKEKSTTDLEKYVGTTKCSEKSWADSKGVSLHKLDASETEVLEKSSLSEEHGQPISLPVPSTSSESTETSNKRKRNSSHEDDNRANGNIIRFKLSSKKQIVSDASVDEQRLCSTSGRTDAAPSQNKIDLFHGKGRKDNLGTGKIGQELELKTDGLFCSTSGKIEPAVPTKTVRLSSMQKQELQYKSLFENWVPPLLQDLPPLESDDSDWLFQSKKSGVEKRQCAGNESLLCSSSSTSWPRAQYLPEVDVYALPYTIPF